MQFLETNCAVSSYNNLTMTNKTFNPYTEMMAVTKLRQLIRKMSKVELADQLGISRTTLDAWLDGGQIRRNNVKLIIDFKADEFPLNLQDSIIDVRVVKVYGQRYVYECRPPSGDEYTYHDGNIGRIARVKGADDQFVLIDPYGDVHDLPEIPNTVIVGTVTDITFPDKD